MPASSFRLTSEVFQEGGLIPIVYTCDGKDISPPLAWQGAPEGTRSYALILDDPDARNFVHWLIFNIPGAQSDLSEDVVRADQLENGARQGKNSWGRTGYGGPCPPSGTHHYRFVLYALDATLNLPAGADRTRLEAAMRGHTLAQAQLIGRYSRQAR